MNDIAYKEKFLGNIILSRIRDDVSGNLNRIGYNRKAVLEIIGDSFFVARNKSCNRLYHISDRLYQIY